MGRWVDVDDEFIADFGDPFVGAETDQLLIELERAGLIDDDNEPDFRIVISKFFEDQNRGRE